MRTSLIVDLNKFINNIATVKNKLNPKTKILAVVKADAYGHGAVMISKIAEDEGVAYLGVATIDEAIEIREAGIKMPILILTEPTDLERLKGVLYYDISLTVFSDSFLNELQILTNELHKKVKVHLKVNTGMNRVGINVKDALKMVNTILTNKNLELEGLFTHLSDADNHDHSYTNNQLTVFNKLIENLEAEGIHIPIKHAANSMATLNHPAAHFDMVRVGLVLYKDIMTFKAKLIHVHDVEKDAEIGYCRTYKTNNTMRIGVVSVGYADGYSRALSNKASVLIKGQLCPVVGNVCMDMIMVSIPNNLRVKVGDEVTLIGSEGNKKITVNDIAKLCNTIDYEVMCSIGKRVPRVYKR
ncbi:MAG: alanine racemase [Candidatus Margulisbacteria bacterium GWF2_35_9]|nr:MAG: alanine racemase [Candidatus Margulisbacteria bacterium GWF2_35_9]